MPHLTEQQLRFFETFGYLALPGAIRDDVGWISDEFEAAWRAVHIAHGGEKHSGYPGVMAMGTERLQTLYDHPVVTGALDSLLGDGWSVHGGDGNFYVGDTGWHSDCGDDQWEAKTTLRHIKIAFYLDRLTRDTGALRVIPGSHHLGDRYTRLLSEGGLGDPRLLGVTGDQVPAVALEITPGDLVIFDHRLKHAAFGGGNRRRMFTMNIFGSIAGAAEREAALFIMRYYRDREKSDWMYWVRATEHWPAERLRRVAGVRELAPLVMGETAATAASPAPAA
jgi:hypothetical protein